MEYEQLKQDLFWQLQPLILNYGIDEDCPYLKQLVYKAYEQGEVDTEDRIAFYE